MRWLCLPILLLAGCSVPSVEYFGAEPKRASVNGFDYVIYHKPGDTFVEVHRVSSHIPPPGRMQVLAGAVQAIGQVTGCRVKSGSLIGDSTLMRAQVQCPAA